MMRGVNLSASLVPWHPRWVSTTHCATVDMCMIERQVCITSRADIIIPIGAVSSTPIPSFPPAKVFLALNYLENARRKIAVKNVGKFQSYLAAVAEIISGLPVGEIGKFISGR